MSPRFGYLNANVNGAYLSMTPQGSLPMPKSLAQMAAKCFQNGEAAFRHGMFMASVDGSNAFYMRACSRRQSQATSASEATCVFAETSLVQPEDFFDENLDKLIGYSFPSEVDIVNGEGPSSANPASAISVAKIDDSVKKAVLYGCFGRLANRVKPVYFAIADDSFEDTAASVLKAVYLAMPYCARAHSGYITYPYAAHAVPGNVILCFIPESWGPRFKGEPVLCLDPLKCEGAIAEVIGRSNLDANTIQYLDAIATSLINKQEWHDAFYKLVEGDGDVDAFSSVAWSYYGEMFVLHKSWSSFSNDEKDKYSIDFAVKAALPDFAYALISQHFTDERFGVLLAKAAEAANDFNEFALCIEPYLPIKDELGLERAWCDSLSNFVEKIKAEPGIMAQFQSAKPKLSEIFASSVIDQCEKHVLSCHQMQAATELQAKLEELEAVKQNSQMLPQLLEGCLGVYEKLDYAQNEAVLREAAASHISWHFAYSCQNDVSFLKYFEIEQAYKALNGDMAVFCGADIQIEWSNYEHKYKEYAESKVNIDSYLKKASKGGNCLPSPAWTVGSYVSAFLDHAKGGDYSSEAKAFLWVQAFKDMEELARDPIDFASLWGDREFSLKDLYKRCIECSIFGSHFEVALQENGQVLIPLADIASFIGWLSFGFDSISLSDEQMWLAKFLAGKNCYNQRHCLQLLSEGGKNGYLKQRIAIAGYAVLAGFVFESRDGKKGLNALEFLANNTKSAGLLELEEFFIIETTEQERLHNIWHACFYPNSADSRNDSANQGKKRQEIAEAPKKFVLGIVDAITKTIKR